MIGHDRDGPLEQVVLPLGAGPAEGEEPVEATPLASCASRRMAMSGNQRQVEVDRAGGQVAG